MRDDLRCKVVGEGANLGFTQRGRVEYALKGGRINTDAIDNSAGVDTSDHEVNIKILLNEVVAAGDMTRKQRDKLLTEMTDEVAHARPARQLPADPGAVGGRRRQAPAPARPACPLHARAGAGRQARPRDRVPADRRGDRASARPPGHGLTRPELAVLLAYAKITLDDELLPSDLPDDPQLGDELMRYFPQPLAGEFHGRASPATACGGRSSPP